jgi:hypothetical protein
MPKAYKILKRFHIHLVITLFLLIFIIIMSIFTSNNSQRILAQNNETNTNNSNEEGYFVNSFQTSHQIPFANSQLPGTGGKMGEKRI